MDKKGNFGNIVDFEGLKIILASPQDVLNWSYGEISKPETINYRTLKPEKDGLFDERIFGPTKDWECYCGKYKTIRYKGIICDKCGVEVTLSRVRRERMGHISLSSPVCHVWFFKGASSPLSLILDMSQKNLESVIYYASYLVIDIDENKKKESLAALEKNIETRKKQQRDEIVLAEKEIEREIKEKKNEVRKGKLAKVQKDLVYKELELVQRQKIAALSERLVEEEKKLDEIYEALSHLLKNLRIGTVLSEDEYFKILEYDIPVVFSMRTGAEGILELLGKIDLSDLIIKLRSEAEKSKGQKYLKLIKRLRLIESMRKAGVSPLSMIITVLPVLPPDLRPMVQLAGGRFATSDLNDLYRRIINRNNRLKRLISLGAP